MCRHRVRRATREPYGSAGHGGAWAASRPRAVSPISGTRKGRTAEPTAAIIDAQSVRAAATVPERAAAGVCGRRRSVKGRA